jgi:hypothetical protein
MKKFFKWIGIGFVGLFVIGMFMDGDETTIEVQNAPVETAAVEDETSAETGIVDEEISKETAATEEKKAEKPKKEKKTYGLGEEVQVDKLTYRINSVEETTELKMEFFDPMVTEGKFIIVDLTVKNNDKEARFFDSEMLRLVDVDGIEFSPDSEADMYVNEDIGFFLEEINPKMSKTGKAVFEVPTDAGELVLQVSSGFGWSGGKYEVIQLK